MNYKQQHRLETRLQELCDLFGVRTCTVSVFQDYFTVTTETTTVEHSWTLDILQHYFPISLYGSITFYETVSATASGRKFCRFTVKLPTKFKLDAQVNRLVDAAELAVALRGGDLPAS